MEDYEASLAYQGIRSVTPRDVIRDAAQSSLISDPKSWFVFLENRNLTSNTYKQDVAEDIHHDLPLFKSELSALSPAEKA